MARHSHWHQIRLKKGVADQKRGKVFTRHARLIEVAARKAGGDPNTNAGLRLAMDNARADNMPRENIDRAVKKGTGELKGATELHELTYEGFGPGGTALLIETLTDNKNRTNQRVRGIVEEHGGHLGSIGSTSFMFERKGMIVVTGRGDRDTDELEIIDAGAEDLQESDGKFIIYTVANELGEVRKKLEAKGFKVESSELTNVPKNLVEVADKKDIEHLFALLDALDEEDDVSNVSGNFDIKE